MKKLLVTDKGIGIAEMPEKPKEADYKIVAGPNARIGQTHEEYHVVLKLYNSAAKQAIASAPLFEDQERVKEELFYMKTGGPQVDVPVGSTYPIPPDFPEYVEVIQKRTVDSINWYDVLDEFTTETNVEYRTILRFVDKQEQRNHLVELMKEDEKHGMYEESQEELWTEVEIICNHPKTVIRTDEGVRVTSATKQLSELFTIKRK